MLLRSLDRSNGLIVSVLRSPLPYYFDDPRKNTLLTIFFSIAVVGLMVAVQHTIALKIPIIGVTVFAVLFTNIVLLPRLLPNVLDSQDWNVRKYTLFKLWQMLLCGIAIPAACTLAGIHPELSFAEKVLAVCPRIVGYGIIPLAILTLMMRNLRLKESLRDARAANTELEKIQVMKNEIAEGRSSTITIRSETKESLELVLTDLLYVEANDNYSMFCWREGDAVRKRLLRMNLKNAEQQLDNSFFIRCHRSFLVNICAVAGVSGNANGYKLILKDSEAQIAVSRTKGKAVIGKIAQMRDMMQLNSPQKVRN